ncbi:MAG: rhamnogalacturonan lyase [Bryobacteraceae bacterium]
MNVSRVGIRSGVTIAALLALAASASAQRQMEKLGRGVVAINQGEGKVFVSWRLLGTEPASIGFNVYRASGAAGPVKLNDAPLTKATNFQDTGVDFSQPVSYTVRAVLNGREQPASKAFTFPANAPARPYISIPLKEGLTPNDGAAGDLDGDGEYEIVLKREDGGRDPSRGGASGETHLEAYKLDGTFMWRINLGKNIRSGANYTPFIVYDLDGDGKAEVVCRTADGTIDGVGKAIGDPKADWREPEGAFIDQAPWMTNQPPVWTRPPRHMDISGLILSGPEYLTVFNGETGAAMATVPYIPPRHPTKLKPSTEDLTNIWGSGMGNNDGRFLAAVAYLDGVHPSVVMCRGYYTRTVLVAWDWRNGKLTQRWIFDSDAPGFGKDGRRNRDYEGQGNHSLTVADVDGDGKDEIVYGAAAIDHDGRGLYTTGLGHGDAEHVSAFDPSRPGLQIFDIHEVPQHPYSAELHEAATGKMIWGKPGVETRGVRPPDYGRALAADADPRYAGAQFFVGGSAYDLKGETIPVRGGANFAIWWDGDLLREFLNSNVITKWNWEKSTMDTIFTAEGCVSNNGSKSTPVLSADILGDWREEVIERTADNKELRIYTTVIPTEHRFYTLMHDPQYRESIALQNVGYNQPPWTSFFLGYGMKTPPKPNIVLVTPK